MYLEFKLKRYLLMFLKLNVEKKYILYKINSSGKMDGGDYYINFYLINTENATRSENILYLDKHFNLLNYKLDI